ncbi:hypothetical protein [Methylophilus sp.]|jgi:hypothetical protein|uniref:hypothetical protein n=1 Tax=Methylophilus sp. TaxID=29541 RepID=UPI0011D9CB1D|nr:hypothetical protein [Methylophilus sp.]TXI45016.1 MAG: protein kinase [Methylophilus sp.]
MAKNFRRMTDRDVAQVVAELDRWALGALGSKLTWSALEERFQFSRQSLQAKSAIKAAYLEAKQALSGGLVKTKDQAIKQAEDLQVEIRRLKSEVEASSRREKIWLLRWQTIAFNIRNQGIQMTNVDKKLNGKVNLPSKTETAKILKPFEKPLGEK